MNIKHLLVVLVLILLLLNSGCLSTLSIISKGDVDAHGTPTLLILGDGALGFSIADKTDKNNDHSIDKSKAVSYWLVITLFDIILLPLTFPARDTSKSNPKHSDKQ